MHDEFPVVQPYFELHLTREEVTLIHAKRGSGLLRRKLGMEAYNQWHLPRLSAEYLLRCDGQTSHGEISRRLQLPFPSLADQIAHHIMAATGALAMSAQPVTESASLFVTGSFDSYAPLHMSVGAYASAVEAVRRLKALGLCVRVAMSVTSQNVEQVVHVFKVAKELRADAFSAATTTAFGRGAGITSCGATDRELQHRLIEIYPLRRRPALRREPRLREVHGRI
jgi:hypothetical protein